MKRVVIESPYSGDIDKNVRYARMAERDCLLRGEAPYASHLLYTQPGVLRDEVSEERKLGMEAGFAWGEVAELIVVYCDLGVSDGMKEGIKLHKKAGRKIEYRRLGGWGDSNRADQGP